MQITQSMIIKLVGGAIVAAIVWVVIGPIAGAGIFAAAIGMVLREANQNSSDSN